jgi:hypothetical protein
LFSLSFFLSHLFILHSILLTLVLSLILVRCLCTWNVASHFAVT